MNWTVIALNFDTNTAYLCEVTTHIRGLLYKNNQETGQLNLKWNGIYASNSDLDNFLDNKSGENWSATQTVPPENVRIDSVTDQSITLLWVAIEYPNDTGRYRVWYSNTQGGPYSDCGTTSSKSTTSLKVTRLSPATKYYFVVRTETDNHANNQNSIVSDPSEEVSATTQ